MVEGAELMECLPAKHHKDEYGRELTEAERMDAVEEACDALCFILEILILLGVDTPGKVAGYYMAKVSVNHARQDKGY